MNLRGYYRASVSVEEVGILLAVEDSPLIWKDYEEKIYHRARQQNFLSDEIPDIKSQTKQDVVSKALARAVEALDKLGVTKIWHYKIIDRSHNDRFSNIWFADKPVISEGDIGDKKETR